MHEDVAILFVLDLGTGAVYRDRFDTDVHDRVEEIQEQCGIADGDEKKLKERLVESEHVNVEIGTYGLVKDG